MGFAVIWVPLITALFAQLMMTPAQWLWAQSVPISSCKSDKRAAYAKQLVHWSGYLR